MVLQKFKHAPDPNQFITAEDSVGEDNFIEIRQYVYEGLTFSHVKFYHNLLSTGFWKFTEKTIQIKATVGGLKVKDSLLR